MYVFDGRAARGESMQMHRRRGVEKYKERTNAVTDLH